LGGSQVDEFCSIFVAHHQHEMLHAVRRTVEENGQPRDEPRIALSGDDLLCRSNKTKRIAEIFPVLHGPKWISSSEADQIKILCRPFGAVVPSALYAGSVGSRDLKPSYGLSDPLAISKLK